MGNCKLRTVYSNLVDQITGQLHLSKSIPNECFKSILCQKTYTKYYLLMNNCNLRMHRSFKFQVYECQNPSIEPWIRSVKLSQQLPIRLEHMDKLLTEFPRSGMHRGSLHPTHEPTPLPPLFPLLVF